MTVGRGERGRSRSRPRRSGEDPPPAVLALVVPSAPDGRGGGGAGGRTAARDGCEERTHDERTRDEGRRSKSAARNTAEEWERRAAPRARSSSRPGRGEDLHRSVPVLAASARGARRDYGEEARSRASRPRCRHKAPDDRPTSGSGNPAAQERSRSTSARAPARDVSRSKSVNDLRGHCDGTETPSEGARSRRTGTTHPESLNPNEKEDPEPRSPRRSPAPLTAPAADRPVPLAGRLGRGRGRAAPGWTTSTTAGMTPLAWSRCGTRNGGQHDNSLSFARWRRQMRCSPGRVRWTKPQPHSSNSAVPWQ